jgi:hypothetical protein
MLDYPEATIVFCTALSQVPWKETQKVTYRPRNFERLLTFAGIDPHRVRVSPVMAEQFHIQCRNMDDADRTLSRLMELRVSGKPAMIARKEGYSVFAGCGLFSLQDGTQTIECGVSTEKLKFSDLFYMIHTIRSGKHARPGMLWIRSGRNKTVTQTVSIAAVAPTVLSMMGIEPPEHMKERPLPV